MSDWRASSSQEVLADRIHELNILAEPVANLERGRPQQDDPSDEMAASPTKKASAPAVHDKQLTWKPAALSARRFDAT